MLRISFYVICWHAITIVTGGHKSYTNESFTFDGRTCITDCIDHQCMVEWRGGKVGCKPGYTTALKYYTIRHRSLEKFCVSRCGKFNDRDKINWCYVSDDEWDQCNPELGNKIVRNEMITNPHEPCRGDCAYHGNSYTWCYTFEDSWQYCDAKLKIDIMQSKTIYGLQCFGTCGNYGSPHNWCIDTSLKWNRCAPPARDFSTFRDMYRFYMKVFYDGPCQKQDQRCSKRSFLCEAGLCDGVVDSISDHVTILEHGENYLYLVTRNVTESGNPINRYTVIPPSLTDDPTLPVVVKAKVTNRTLRYPNCDNIDDSAIYRGGQDGGNGGGRRLIAKILGGPDDAYNFAPHTQYLNEGEGQQWYRTQQYIHAFISLTAGWAEITVLVIYNDLPSKMRPNGFVADVALYYPNNKLHDECRNKYYSNEPNVKGNR